MEYTIVLITVLSCIAAMYFCLMDVKAEVDGTERRKPYEIIILSFLLGSYGVLFAHWIFGYQKGNEKGMIVHYLFAVIHSILIGTIML